MRPKGDRKSQPRAQKVEPPFVNLSAAPAMAAILREFCFPGNGERLKIV
jgi:hypothetical protein